MSIMQARIAWTTNPVTCTAVCQCALALNSTLASALQAGQLSEELGDKRAERAVARATANAYREVSSFSCTLQDANLISVHRHVADHHLSGLA